MISLLYDRKTEEIQIQQDSNEPTELDDSRRISVVLIPNEKPQKKTRIVSERYVPKMEKKSDEENPYLNASANELLRFPIKSFDHLEVIENILKTDSVENLAFREELVSF